MKEIVITDLQQGLLGNKCGSDNFIRGLSQATQGLYGDLSLSTVLISLFSPSFPLPVLSPPWLSSLKKKKKKVCLPMLEAQVQSLGREDSLKEEMTTYSSIICLGNPMERGAWWARVHGVAKSQTRLRDSTTALSPPRSLSFPSRPCRPRLQQELEPQEGTSP